MRLPNTAHTSRPWRIHELTPDFQLEDVWALRTTGGPGELPRLVSQTVSGNFLQGAPLVVRVLWAARWKIGRLLRWDGPDTGLGSRVPTLRDRFPTDLRGAPTGPDFDTLPFTSLYQLENEFAAEMANRTVQAVMHLSWGPGGIRWLPRPVGRPGEAQRTVRDRLHGSDQADPLHDRVPGSNGTEGAQVAGTRRRSGTGAAVR